MGGKSNILDPKQLESIYLESCLFDQKAHASMQIIQNELVMLTNPSFLSGLTGRQSDAAKNAIANVNEAIDILKQTLATTSEFIDAKLAGAAQLAQDKISYSDAISKGIVVDIKLKK
jgi:hypothetical protein